MKVLRIPGNHVVMGAGGAYATVAPGRIEGAVEGGIV